MKKYVLGVLGLLILLLGGALYARHELFRRAAGLPEFTTANWVASTVELPMRDGVKLHTEIYLPQGLERAPTILVRSPYEYLKPIEAMQCQTLTRFGYACVLQDVRGQMASEGDWEPVLHERDDGLDTLAWLVKQPFVDGNIGMRGPSYLTFVGAYAVACTVGLASSVPGGVGVFESAMAALLPGVEAAALAAAFLGYRLSYYILPLILAAGALGIETLRSARRG